GRADAPRSAARGYHRCRSWGGSRRALAALTWTQLAQGFVTVDAGIVSVAPLDAERIAADHADLHRVQVARTADHREEAARFAFATAGAGAVVAQVAIRVDAAVPVVPGDFNAVLRQPPDGRWAARGGRLRRHDS